MQDHEAGDWCYASVASNLEIGQTMVYVEAGRRIHPYAHLMGWASDALQDHVMHYVTRTKSGYCYGILVDHDQYIEALAAVRFTP